MVRVQCAHFGAYASIIRSTLILLDEGYFLTKGVDSFYYYILHPESLKIKHMIHNIPFGFLRDNGLIIQCPEYGSWHITNQEYEVIYK